MIVERDKNGTVIVDGEATRYSVHNDDRRVWMVAKDGDRWVAVERTANIAMLHAARLHLMMDVQEADE